MVKRKKSRATPMLLRALDRMSPQQRAIVRRMYEYHERQCKDAVAQRAQPEGTAVGIHGAVDVAIGHLWHEQPHNAARVACRNGCAHCCHLNVDVSEIEARLLLHAAAEARLEIDVERLRVQAAAPDFRALPLEQRRCVFLRDDQTCGVYEHRPTGCRKYFVVDTAEFCDTVKHPGHDVGILFSVEAEVIHAATLDAWPAGPMPRMLLQLIEGAKHETADPHVGRV